MEIVREETVRKETSAGVGQVREKREADRQGRDK